MTAPPLPDSPVVRVRLDYKNVDGYLGGSRFYLGYAAGAPTPGNCATLASDIATAWGTDLAQLVDNNWSLVEVDVLDITTVTGSSGQWTGNTPGSDAGNSYPAQVATNVEYLIANRYRGGKPRMFLPSATQSNALDAGHWTTAFVDLVNTQVAAFFAALSALSIGAMGALHHVNVSYYSGFTNVTNSSGRTRAAPKYRAAAQVGSVEGYSCKATMGSQKRRRNATTY